MLEKQIFNIDPGAELLFSTKGDEFEFNGVSIASYLTDNTIVFIKDKKFFKRVMDALRGKSFSNLGLIIAQSFWKVLSQQDQLKETFAYILGVEDVTLFMTNLSKVLYEEKFGEIDTLKDGRESGDVEISESAIIAPNAFIGKKVKIGASVKIHSGVVIMSNVEVGDNSELFPNVTLYSYSQIGKNCRIHSGVVIGSDGFGYNFYEGLHRKVWHTGGTIIEDNVEIGANACVDMGTFTPTIIRAGTKIDNQVQIAHNVELGQGAILCGQVGIGGSVNVGAYTVFGGQAGVTHDVTIGSQAQIGGFSAVTSNVEPQSAIAGTPARPIKEWLAGLAYVRKNSIKKRS